MANRYGYIINSDGTTAPLSDPDALHRGEAAQNAENLGGNPPAYYTPYDNRVDNGNFRQFVAQAGIGGNHGTQAYGGDRWILDSGTITGEANANGLGYGSITLNGTIRQIIAEPQETMTAFVGMISGTATVAYTYTDGVGELTITSVGGVLDWVMLLPGEWESAPPYVPKGYGAELTVCQTYHLTVSALTTTSCIYNGAQKCSFSINTPAKMRIKPTMMFVGTQNGGLYQGTASAVTLDVSKASLEVKSVGNTTIQVDVNADVTHNFTQYREGMIRLPNYQLNADL